MFTMTQQKDSHNNYYTDGTSLIDKHTTNTTITIITQLVHYNFTTSHNRTKIHNTLSCKEHHTQGIKIYIVIT